MTMKVDLGRSGESTQWIKCLLCVRNGVHVPRHHGDVGGMKQPACNLSTQKAETKDPEQAGKLYYW